LETRKNRTSIADLRTSDPKRLEVLAPEVLSQPIGQIDPSTLVDLIALSELTEQLPTAFNRDLEKFRKRIFDQINDLPESPDLARFVEELAGLEADQIPQSLREFLADELLPSTSHSDALQFLNQLAAKLADSPAQIISLPTPPPTSKKAAATRKAAAKKPAKKPRTTRISAAQVDDRRAEWIEEDVLNRLSNYGSRGLKQSIVVAGSRHRSSWKDLSEAEVLAVLRRLKRESKVRFSAGRWMIQT
jgi:hypothetical protein